MLTKTKLVLAVAFVLGTGSFAVAADHDGYNNGVPGVQRQVASSTVGRHARAYARAIPSYEPTISAANRDGWENRSVFYQGPTYIGRY